jgi:D-alanyl-D-alanine carboxypeptidase (penicillin-binding protein 5/6)
VGGTLRPLPIWTRPALAVAVAVWPAAGPEALAQASPASTTTTTDAPAPNFALPDPASAAILIDVDTGRALYEDNAHQPLPPGSLTKMLTAMIAVDWLPPGADIPVTTVAFNAYPDKVGMKPGQRWPLDITMPALITDSANDAAYALGVYIGGGSLAGFVPILHQAADQIGMSDHPTLEDPAGLDYSEGFDGGNRISAWDLSIMGRDMMAIPQLAAIAGLRTYDFEGPDGIAYHLLSRNYHFLASYPGAIGVKTGYTDAAGFCDTEEAVSGGRHMLAVVLHSTNPDADAAALISAGFTVSVAAEGDDPQLPPVARPEPVRASPPTTAPTLRTGPAATSAVVADPAVVDHAHNSFLGIAAIAAAGLVALVVGLWTRRFRQQERRAGAGRRRSAHAARPRRRR